MDKKFLVRFGKLVRKARLAKKLSQEKLAFQADITSGYLGKIELGKANPSILVVCKIVKALNMTIADFIKRSRAFPC